MDIAHFLKEEVPLFRFVEPRLIDTLVQDSTVTTFEEHEAVIEFGEEGHFVGILLEGTAEVSVYDDAGNKRQIEILSKGAVFGEMSLMSGDKTVADVIGLSRCRALLIPHPLLSEVLVSHPHMIAEISELIKKRLETIRPSDHDNLLKRALRKSLDPYGLSLKKPGAPERILALSFTGEELSFTLHETKEGTRLAAGVFKELSTEKSHFVFFNGKEEQRFPVPHRELGALFSLLEKALFTGEKAPLAGPEQVTAVGHHLISGGDVFSSSTLLSNDALAKLETLNALHKEFNAPGVAAAHEARTRFPQATHVAVFDSSFHSSLPPYAFLYALPYELVVEKKVRRRGYHGITHQYAALKAAQYLNRPYNELEVAVCFLDTESSLCAVDHGRSVEVSAGFTPADGLVAGNSAGSVDPNLLFYLTDQAGFSYRETSALFREKGGLKGLSGISPSLREIEAHADLGHHRALLAYKLYCYSIRKKIGEALAAMGGLDVLVFTGSIGYASPGIRSLACQGLDAMGIALDEKRNRALLESDETALISRSDSPVKVLVVRPNRTLMIARETLKALSAEKASKLLQKQEAIPVPIEVSAHHVHLTARHVAALFGAGHGLEVAHPLSQPGQFASKQTVTLVGPKGMIDRVRVLGPERAATQVEIAMTEQFKLGIEPPIRESGDIDGSPGVVIEGPAGSVILEKGVICARRHIHMSPDDALRFGLHDKDVVRVRVSGDRELVFGDVVVRVHPSYRLMMHIDTDEANASHVKDGQIGYIEGIQRRE